MWSLSQSICGTVLTLLAMMWDDTATLWRAQWGEWHSMVSWWRSAKAPVDSMICLKGGHRARSRSCLPPTSPTPFPSKNLPHTVAIAFAVCDATANVVRISFSFFTVSRIEALTADLSNCTIWFLFFPYFKSRTFAFSLKGSTLLSGLSELPPAWLLCSGAIRKRNEDLVTTAPWRHTWSDTWEARSVTGRRVGCAAWAHWTKGWFTFQAGQRGTAWDFISPLRTVCSLKRLTCLFLEFSISYFQMTVDHRQLKLDMRPWIRGEYLAGNRWLSYQLNGRRNENFRDLNNGDHHLVDQLDIHCLLLTVKVPTAQIKPFLSSLARTIRFYIGFANSSTHLCFVLFCCIPVSSISETFLYISHHTIECASQRNG